MKQRRYPWVFRIAAALLLLSVVAGQWWQRQPAGEVGLALLTIIAAHCPAGAHRQPGRISVADSARALDRWGYATSGSAAPGSPSPLSHLPPYRWPAPKRNRHGTCEEPSG